MKARAFAMMLVMGSSAFAGNSDIGSSGSGSGIQSVGKGEIGYTQMEYCERRYYRTGQRADPFALSEERSLAQVEITDPQITFTGKGLEEPSVIYTGNQGESYTIEPTYYASLRVSSARASIDSADSGPSWIEGYQMVDENAFSVEGTNLIYTKKNGKKKIIADLRGGRIEQDGYYDNYCKVIGNAHSLFNLKIVRGKLGFFHHIPGCTLGSFDCTDIRVEREPRRIRVQLK